MHIAFSVATQYTEAIAVEHSKLASRDTLPHLGVLQKIAMSAHEYSLRNGADHQ